MVVICACLLATITLLNADLATLAAFLLGVVAVLVGRLLDEVLKR
jgi:hypothetical protein